MPVIQPTILPQDSVPSPRFFSQFQEGFQPFQDLLLRAILSGQFNKVPLPQTPQTPATLRFPSGVQTQISPAEQVARGPMAGQTFEQLSRAGALPRGIKFQPTTVNPQQLQQMVNLATLQKSQVDIAKAPFEQKKLEAETSKIQAEAELYQSGGVPVYTVDPTTGQMRVVGTVNPKSKVVTGTTPLEKTMASQSARTAIRSIGKIRNLIDPDFGGDPKLLLSAGIPGIQGSRALAKAFASVKLEIVTARGGKQLTPSEQALVKATFPNTADGIDALLRKDPSVIQDALDEMELVSQGMIQGLGVDVIQQQIDELRVARETEGQASPQTNEEFEILSVK